MKEDKIRIIKDMHVEVNIQSRILTVFDGSHPVLEFPVAVGRPEWPTREGRWRIYEVVWNPWWHPPDEEWAWYRAIKAPGDPDNPLGRAQLIYDAPRSIHGTNEPNSIGKAVSHGSIRVSNEDGMYLVRLAMESSGTGKEEAWYKRMEEERYKNVRIRLPVPIPIRVHNGR